MIRQSIHKYPLFILILCSGFARAQFRNKADIDSVRQSGFFAIKITPALSSLIKTNFDDLRIVDGAGNQIPYLLGSGLQSMDSTLFKPMEIVQNIINDDSGHSVLVVENRKSEKIDGLFLQMRNAAVNRSLVLSGSNDGRKWFSIVENVNLEKRFVQNQDTITEYISFPLSSYRYFRIIIYNGKNDPLDILSVRKFAGMSPAKKDTVIMNPAVSFSRKDSNKITSLIIRNLNGFHINLVQLKVKGPRFYKRQLEVVKGNVLIGSFVISSDSLVVLPLPSFKDSIFTIRIFNEDNEPLSIIDVLTGQSAEKLVTYLELGKSYTLEMNNENLSSPHYDLANFKDSIPKYVQEIGISDIIPMLQAKKPDDNNSKQPWLWPALIFSLIVLGVLTYGLTKDLAKKS